jgi:hypothetical protein
VISLPWIALSLVTELVTVALRCPGLPERIGDNFSDIPDCDAGALK